MWRPSIVALWLLIVAVALGCGEVSLPTADPTAANTHSLLPTSTSTPEPSPTPTLPSPTATPAPTATPTALPTPTSVPAPTAVPIPTETAVPSPTPVLIGERTGEPIRNDPFGADRNCGDFDTWDESQNFYEASSGPEADRHGLDLDRDDIACESLPGGP